VSTAIMVAVRTFVLGGLFLSLATVAMAQVQVGVRLEKARYLAGEPIFVLVDARNVGEAASYSMCGANVTLAVAGVDRRKLPNIFGCDVVSGVSGSGCSHAPLLPPGETKTSRHLLREYDLRPGDYQLKVSGNAGVRATGAEFDQTLALQVVAASDPELQAVFAPLVSDALGAMSERRSYARMAISESAPPFLESLIMQFATEGDTRAIETLGRLATPSSRAHLKASFGNSDYYARASIITALALVAHPDDFEFLAAVLEDTRQDDSTRGYAALGLGRIGGQPAVRRLERALSAAPPRLRPNVERALRNTRSKDCVDDGRRTWPSRRRSR
jgi:hypothetical protein